MSKDAYYFPHDSNARSDPAIITIRRKYGWEGYGSYFGIIEFLREQQNYRVNNERTDDCVFELRINPEIFEALFDVGLLKRDETSFFSESLLRRMAHIDGIRDKRRASGKAGGDKSASSKQDNSKCSSKTQPNAQANYKQMLEQPSTKSDANAQAIKEKKSKENKSKEKKENPLPQKTAALVIPFLLDTPNFRKSWEEWKNHRREKKKPLTPMGEQKTIEALAKFGSEWAIDRINKAISAGWQGLIFDSDKPEPTQQQKPQNLPPNCIPVVL